MQRQYVKFLRSGIAALAMLFASQAAHAEIYGQIHGRSADVARMPDLSLDTGLSFGDDYRVFGVRVNYKLTPIFLVYGDVGFAELGAADGVPIGIGAMYTLEGLLQSVDVGFKISYHRASFKFRSADFTASNIALEALMSSQRGFGPNGNIDVYGNLGFQFFGGDGPDETELSFGGGVIFPAGPGEVFVGLDFVDDAVFGGGFRYFF